MAVESAQRIPTIVAQKAELECGSTTNNEKRRESVVFTIPHYITGTRFAVRSNSNIQALRDFRGRKVVAVADSTNLATVKNANQEGLLGMDVMPVPTADKAMSMVEGAPPMVLPWMTSFCMP